MHKQCHSLHHSWLSILLILSLALSLLGGCGKRSTKTEDPSLSETLIEDVVEIPADGIITADQFNAFAGTDRTISFIGSSDNISYTWDYNGRNIHNALDMDLSIDFITEEDRLADIKKASNNAPYALGMVLKGNGTITVPTLTIVYPEAWDADTAVFCKEIDGSMYRMSDAAITVDPDKDTTTLSMKIMELGDTYYLVAGSSTAPVSQETESAAEAEGETASEAAEESTAEESTAAGSTTPQQAQSSDSQSISKDTSAAKQETVKESTKAAAATTPAPASSKAEKETKKTISCTICINCSTILDNMDQLEADKAEFVPSDGWILMPTTVEVNQGSTVMDVLIAVCKAYKIHIEHNKSYVEGINQLYEFDCGELSGWMYSVDGWFPNYGADEYVLSDGETIRWSYTCDLGKDVGDNSKW